MPILFSGPISFNLLYRKYLIPMGMARLKGVAYSLKNKEELNIEIKKDEKPLKLNSNYIIITASVDPFSSIRRPARVLLSVCTAVCFVSESGRPALLHRFECLYFGTVVSQYCLS